MDDLYNHTNALIQQTQELFKNLSHGPNREHVEKEIQEKIDTISRLAVVIWRGATSDHTVFVPQQLPETRAADHEVAGDGPR